MFDGEPNCLPSPLIFQNNNGPFCSGSRPNWIYHVAPEAFENAYGVMQKMLKMVKGSEFKCKVEQRNKLWKLRKIFSIIIMDKMFVITIDLQF